MAISLILLNRYSVVTECNICKDQHGNYSRQPPNARNSSNK